MPEKQITFSIPWQSGNLRSNHKSIQHSAHRFLYPGSTVRQSKRADYRREIPAADHRTESPSGEVFDRIDTSTISGRLCYPVTDRFIVQWDEMKNIYPKSINLGSIF